MPRHRDNRSPIRERRIEKHKKRRSRSSSSEENEHKSRRSKHQRDNNRSRSYSEDRQHHRHKHRKHRHNREENDYDPNRKIKQERTDNESQQRQERNQNDARRNRSHQQRLADGVDMNFGRQEQNPEGQQQEKQKPDFKLSGKLTEDTNTFRGVVVNYNEPPEARKPKKKWRLYPFKGDTELPVLHIHRQSAYLIGRDRRVADIPVDHPSCSKQHAALQFRLTDFKKEDGSRGRKVRPYVIDLNSANGTYVNNQKIDGQKYVELLEKDVVKFGYSSREYVILHDKVDTSEVGEGEEDDD